LDGDFVLTQELDCSQIRRFAPGTHHDLLGSFSCSSRMGDDAGAAMYVRSFVCGEELDRLMRLVDDQVLEVLVVAH
jgi:hypothetical protein